MYHSTQYCLPSSTPLRFKLYDQLGIMMSHSTNLFARAQTVIPGGVNSPVRAFKGVGGTPVFFKEGKMVFKSAKRKV